MAGDALNFLSRETFRVPDLDGMQFEPVGNKKKKLIKKAPICHYSILNHGWFFGRLEPLRRRVDLAGLALGPQDPAAKSLPKIQLLLDSLRTGQHTPHEEPVVRHAPDRDRPNNGSILMDQWSTLALTNLLQWIFRLPSGGPRFTRVPDTPDALYR
ncbi:hypothetical protein RP20_CCG024557 [Aedes albopictus]|nr:hypothetical protein RP20_CCG024557 [Aedes albopictus]